MDSELVEEVDITVSQTTETAESAKPHSLAVHLLIVLAAVVLLVTAVNVWVDRAALNTDNWVDASDQLLAEQLVGRQPNRPPDDRQHPRGRHEGRSTLDLRWERHTRPA